MEFIIGVTMVFILTLTIFIKLFIDLGLRDGLKIIAIIGLK